MVVLIFDMGKGGGNAWANPAQQIISEDFGILGWDWGPDEQEMAMLAASKAGLTIDLLRLADGSRRILTPMGKLDDTQIDVVALWNMISWVP